jgi:membrane protease YdiL (CAAX protease family)
MCVFVFAVAWMIGAAKVDLNLERLAGLNPATTSPVELPEGLSEQQFVLLLAVANLTVVNIPGVLLGFGEEFGWRGYLFPCLLPLGRMRAFVLVGFVWWAWHLPLSFIQPADSRTTMEVLSTHLFGLAGAVCYGAVLVWIRYASGSIFPVALAHISFNNITAAGVILMDLRAEAQPLLNMTAAALVCAVLWRFKAWDVVPS